MDNKTQNRIYILYILIVLTAVSLRFWRLTEIAYTVWLDEAWFGFSAAKILAGETWMPLQIADELGIGDSAFQIYSAAAMQLLGVSQTFSSRFSSALWGSTAVILTFPVLLNILPKETARRQYIALIATFVMATLTTGLIHSRHGLQMASSVALALIFLYGFTHLHKTGEWRWAIFTGISIGIGMTTYEAFLGVPVYVIAYTLLRLAFPSTLTRRQLLTTGLATGLVALLTWSPLILFYINNPGIYFSHGIKTVNFDVAETTSLWGSLSSLISTGIVGFGRVWGGVSFVGDAIPGRNIPYSPLFNPIVSICFWVGLVHTAWKQWKKPAFQMLLLWLLVFTLPSALSNQAPAFSRMLPMTPILAGFAGLGLFSIWEFVGNWQLNKTAQQGIKTAVMLSVIISSLWSVYAYFNIWATDNRLFDNHRMGDRLALENAFDLEALGNNVLIVPETNAFLKYPSRVMRADRNSNAVFFDAMTSCVPSPNKQTKDTIFAFIDIPDDQVQGVLEELYPSATRLDDLAVIHPVYGSDHSRYLRIPAGAEPPPPQIATNAYFSEGIQLAGYNLEKQESDVTLTFYWKGEQAVSPAVSYFIHIGQGDISDPLIGNINGELCSGFLPWRWGPGYFYIQTVVVPLTTPQPDGDFDIRIGLYDTITGERLAIESTDLYTENGRLRLQALP